MPILGITTGKEEAPRLELATLEGALGEDWDYCLSFKRGQWILWIRHTPNEAGNQFTNIKKIIIKVTANRKKVTNAQKISETEFTAPELPPADTLDPYNFYYQTYNINLDPPSPCEEESLVRFKLVTKKNEFYTTTSPAQLIPHSSDTLGDTLGGDTLGGDTLPGDTLGEPLNKWLFEHHAFKEDTIDNRAVFYAGAMRNDTDTIIGNDTTGGELKCIYEPNKEDFLVPLAGLMLGKDDNPDEFIIQDFVAVQY